MTEGTRRSYKPLAKGSAAADALKGLLEEVKNQASRYASGTSSNIYEAVNNEITAYAPKRYNLSESYDWRVCLALLKHNEGPEVLIEIIRLLDLPVPRRAIELQVGRAKRRVYFRNRRADAAMKTKRAIGKEKVIIINR